MAHDTTAAASSGIRKNILQRLAGYQPQWLPISPSILSTLPSSSSREQHQSEIPTSTPNGVFLRKPPTKRRDNNNHKVESEINEKKSTLSSLSFSSAGRPGGGDDSENSEFILKSSSTSTTLGVAAAIQQQPQPQHQLQIKPPNGRPAYVQNPRHRHITNRYSFNDVYY